MLLLLTLILELISFSHGCFDNASEAEAEALQRFHTAFPFLKQSVKQVWHVQTAKGDYIGQLNCSSGFRHGWGEMRWANGTLYGPENIFIYSQGDRYFGQWVHDQQQGKAHLLWQIRNMIKTFVFFRHWHLGKPHWDLHRIMEIRIAKWQRHGHLQQWQPIRRRLRKWIQTRRWQVCGNYQW